MDRGRLRRFCLPNVVLPQPLTLSAVFSTFVDNVAAALGDPRVWVSLVIALVCAAVVFAVGYLVARLIGVLDDGSPEAETVGVAVAIGLVVIAVGWAAVASGGRSAFTIPAVVLAASVTWAAIRARVSRSTVQPTRSAEEEPIDRSRRGPGVGLTAFLAAGLFVGLIGLTYGSTVAPSPRDGVQPVDFMDEAFYSMLGAELSRTGVESIYTPSGFAELPGLPTQTWYHWGEIWLESATISVFGLEPMLARHYVVLPIALLAVALLTGTLVRRLTHDPSRRALLVGGAAALVLSPVPVSGTFFGYWARGGIFGVTMYGLALVIVLLIAYLLLQVVRNRADGATVLFTSAVVGSLVPAHIVLAGLAGVGVASAAGVRVVSDLRARTRPSFEWLPRRLAAATILVVVATVAWAFLTGHGLGASAPSQTVTPFNGAWREAVIKTTIASGCLLAIGVVAWSARRRRDPLFWSAVGAIGVLVFGAIAWGARLGDFTMFHVWYGGIAAFATPVAAAAVWAIWQALRGRGHRMAALAVIVVFLGQVEIGVVTSVLRLEEFGPHDYQPVPVAILGAIRGLPPDAKLAYACQPFEELAFWNPKLESIYAHTGRPVVPLCFEAEAFAGMIGGSISPDVPAPFYEHAPQQLLFPTFDHRPTPADVIAFLKANGIDYLYVDAAHPNAFVVDASVIESSGDIQLLRIP
jgi:hypothetical protein